MNKTEYKFLQRVYPLREYPLILTFEMVDFSEKFLKENDFIPFVNVKEDSKTIYLTKVVHNKEDLYALAHNLTKELQTLFKPIEEPSYERGLYEVALVCTVINDLILKLLLYTH